MIIMIDAQQYKMHPGLTKSCYDDGVDYSRNLQSFHPQSLTHAIAFASEFEAFLGPADKIIKPRDIDTFESDFTNSSSELRYADNVTKQETLTMNELSKLLDEKFDKILRKETISNEGRIPNTNEVYGNENNTYQQGYYHGPPKEIRCYFCKEIGHIQNRCRYYKESQGMHQGQRKSNDELNC